MYILTDHGGIECQTKFELCNKQYMENSWSLWSRTNYENGVKLIKFYLELMTAG